MTAFIGRIDSIFSRQFTAALETAAAAGATALTVTDGGDLDEAGQLTTPWDGEVYDYTFDGDVTVTLAAPLASAADEGETLVVWDAAKAAPVVETVAHVVPLGDGVTEDVVEARVSYPLIPLLGEGIRDEENAEAVTVREDSDAYVVAEVLGQAASLTDEFVTDVLVPQLPPLGDEPDGLEPATNPAVTLRPGIGALFVVWEPVDNADPVTYDVYAVPAADVARLTFPPLDTDKVGEVLEGTAAQIRALPDGTDLSPEGSYAIAVYARDADGTCPTDAVPVIGAPAKVNSEDLALNALTVDHLTGNDALFQALQAEDITGVTITGSVITGSTIQTADTGLYWRLSSGAESMKIEAIKTFTDGTAYTNANIGNLGQESTTQRVVGTSLSAGALQSWSGYASGGVNTMVAQSRASSSDPWGPQRYVTQMVGHDVDITATYPHTGDTTPASITLDAKGNEAAVGIHGDHIDISTYTYGGDSVNVSTGVLTLSGDESVTVNGDYRHTGTNLDYAYLDLSVGANNCPSGNSPGTTLTSWTKNAGVGFSGPNGVGEITCQVAGRYLMTCYISFPSTDGGGHQRFVVFYKNGSQHRFGFALNSGGSTVTSGGPKAMPNSHGASISVPVTLAVGDVVKLSAGQNSGSTLTTVAGQGWLTLDRMDK